jgi:23S rRNA (uridine2552-2'-O)-methyltransferase
MGGDEVELKKRLRTHFQKVKHEKPSASRKESTEGFLVATGFRDDTRQLQADV